MLCQKAHEEWGNSWEGDLPKETIGHVTGHIQSAGGLGQREVIIARNACIREVLQNVNAHGKADRHLSFRTIETESNIGTLDQEGVSALLKGGVVGSSEKRRNEDPMKRRE
jgi:hypothetical protein